MCIQNEAGKKPSGFFPQSNSFSCIFGPHTLREDMVQSANQWARKNFSHHIPQQKPLVGVSVNCYDKDTALKKHHVGGKLKTSSTKRKRSPSDQSADAGIAGDGGRDASKRSTHALERGIFLKGKGCFSYFSVLKLREVNFCHWEFSQWTHVFVLTRKQFFFWLFLGQIYSSLFSAQL